MSDRFLQIEVSSFLSRAKIEVIGKVLDANLHNTSEGVEISTFKVEIIGPEGAKEKIQKKFEYLLDKEGNLHITDLEVISELCPVCKTPLSQESIDGGRCIAVNPDTHKPCLHSL